LPSITRGAWIAHAGICTGVFSNGHPYHNNRPFAAS
jgi:hypothetical protein